MLYTGSIDLINPFPPSGEVEDPTNSPLENYVQEATIGGDESDYLTLQGDAQQIVPINTEGIEVYSFVNRIGNGSEFYEEVDGTIDLGVNVAGWNARYLGSKYAYMTYVSSGSNPRVLTYVTASRYDQFEALPPALMTSTYSSQFAPARQMYDRDIYNNRAFTGQRALTASAEFSSSQGAIANLWTNNYGLRLSLTYSGSATGGTYGSSLYGSGIYGSGGTSAIAPLTSSVYWSIDNTNGLYFKPYTAGTGIYTGSLALDAFMYEPNDLHTYDYLYRVTIATDLTGSSGNPRITLYFGGFDSPLSQSYSLSGRQTVSYVTRATGTELGVAIQKSSFSNTEFIKIRSLKVEPLNYRAQVQDYHLTSARGMINARYEGCKLTSTDYNVDSPDTVDNGPVITVTLVGGSTFTSSPATQQGTFQIR